MAKSKTKVINDTGSAVNLTMTTGGIESKVSTEPVRHRGCYTISIDPNATYREYWCAVQSGHTKKVILSSDDCAEYSEVTLRAKQVLDSHGHAVATGAYDWVGTKCRDPTRVPHQASVNANTNGAAPAGPPPSPAPPAVSGSHRSSSSRARSHHCTIL